MPTRRAALRAHEFSVIWLVREPSTADEQALLQQSGPAYPDAGTDYASLLHLTAWSLMERLDVTNEFARCVDVLLEASQTRRPSWRSK